MKFTIPKSELLKALSMVKLAIPSKTTNPILKNILIAAHSEGHVEFRATDTILDISTTVPANVEEESSCCVDGVIYDIVSNFSDEDVKFSLGQKVTISQGRRRHHPLHADMADFPERKTLSDYSQVDCSQFINALRRTAASTSNIPINEILKGFFINPHEKSVITSDGNRVTLWENLDLPGNITIPDSGIIMKILPFLTSGDFDISFGNLVGFRSRTGEWEIIFNSLAGEFPKVAKKAIKEARHADPKLTIKSNTEAIKNVLEICRIYSSRAYSEGRPSDVKLSTNNDSILFSMNVPDLIEMEEHLECEIEGEEFDILFDPQMLVEAIGQVKNENVELRFFSNKLPFILLDDDVPNFTYLQVPMVKTGVESE